MLALPLRLPTAPYGGHMGHFLLSTLALMGSTPLGNTKTYIQNQNRGHQNTRNHTTFRYITAHFEV